MSRGGFRPGSGRPKGAKEGSPTKRAIRKQMTEKIVENAMAEGVMPLEVMLSAMREEWQAGNKRLAAEYAKDAAPYCHAKLAAVEHSGDPENPVAYAVLSGVPREAMDGDEDQDADERQTSAAH